MMSSSEVAEIRSAGIDIHDGLTFSAGRFNRIESDGVNLQCVNSSDFMVGKQTNFNGPVTIINYGEGNEPDDIHKRGEGGVGGGGKAEEVVIKEKIIAPGVAVSMENFVKKKAAEEELKRSQIGGGKSKWRSKICTTKFLKIPAFAWYLILFLILAGCVTLVVELSDDEYPEDGITFPGETRNYTIYSRRQWRAAEEKSSVALQLPVQYVIISSTNTRPCEGLKECRKILQNQQNLQSKRSQADIYPNFLVSSDGFVYEGRGWNKRNAFLGFSNSRNIEISFIGDFAVYAKPTENQTEAAKSFIEYGFREKKFVENYKLVPANATGIFLEREEPIMGSNLYEIVQGWPHFTPDPYHELFPSLKKYLG